MFFDMNLSRSVYMKKVGMISLGCAKNRVDSENMLGMLRGTRL